MFRPGFPFLERHRTHASARSGRFALVFGRSLFVREVVFILAGRGFGSGFFLRARFG